MHKPGQRDFTRYFEQNERARDVRLNYWSWLVDAPIDMGLCGEMNNSITTTHCCLDGSRITDVALHKFIIGIVRY